jgi:hypothetical protein
MWTELLRKPEAIATLGAAIIAAVVSIWNFFASRNQQEEMAHHQNDLETKMQTSLDSFRDTLERHRTYDLFQRERINAHIEKVISAFNELYGLGELININVWVASAKSLEAEQQFRPAWRRLDTHRAALMAFAVISTKLDTELRIASAAVWDAWGVAMGEIYRRDPANLPAGERGFSETELNNAYHQLMDCLCRLRDIVARIGAEINLPR